MVKEITREDFNNIQICLKSKQKFLQKALDSLNKQELEKAKIMLNIEQGFSIEIIRILDEYIITDKCETDEVDETMYEDVNTEQEGEW